MDRELRQKKRRRTCADWIRRKPLDPIICLFDLKHYRLLFPQE